jgi:hypothetical protein
LQQELQRNIEGCAVFQISGSSQVIIPFNAMEEGGEGHLVTALFWNVTSIIMVCYYLIFYLF